MFRSPIFRSLVFVLMSTACVALPVRASAGDPVPLRRLPATAKKTSATAKKTSATAEKTSAGTEPAPTVRDVQLSADGQLLGQLVDAQGVPLQSREIELSDHDGAIGTVLSDAHGHFAFHQVKGGTFLLRAMGAKTPIRVWATGTAPAAAADAILLIALQETVRGKNHSNATGVSVLNAAGGRALLAIPLIIGGAAIIQKDRQDAADDRNVPSAS